jgi:hypothetical protein
MQLADLPQQLLIQLFHRGTTCWGAGSSLLGGRHAACCSCTTHSTSQCGGRTRPWPKPACWLEPDFATSAVAAAASMSQRGKRVKAEPGISPEAAAGGAGPARKKPATQKKAQQPQEIGSVQPAHKHALFQLLLERSYLPEDTCTSFMAKIAGSGPRLHA